MPRKRQRISPTTKAGGYNRLIPHILHKKSGPVGDEDDYTPEDDLFLIAAEKYRSEKGFRTWTLRKMRKFIHEKGF